MQFLKKQIMDFLFNGVPYYPPSQIYLGLQTVSGEPIAEDYKRIDVTGLWSLSKNGQVHNTQQLPYWNPTHSWGECVSVGIYDGDGPTGRLLLSSAFKTKFSAIPNQKIVFAENSVYYTFVGAADYSNSIMNAIFNKQLPTPPKRLFLALCSAEEELRAENYERIEITNCFEEATEEGTVVNFRQLAFPTPSTDWGEIHSAIVYDDSAEGKKVIKVDLKKPMTVNKGQDMTIESGVLQFNFVVRGL